MAKPALMDYDKALEMFEPVLGFEVHVELNTKTKMFSAAPNPAATENHDAAPNTLVAPVDMGLPGSLPVVNAEAIRSSISLGLALGCSIAPSSRRWRGASCASAESICTQELLLPRPRQELPDLAI